ncbi:MULTISPECIES: PepSY-associated TM helix domain-containing protein [unclassified Nitrospina]|uniref:PepSY-associated TM helix domain-containing protein n=1 Tax=unclassified Nitrospina TaxID=2638683 RepID=UPI003F961A3D
MARIFWIKLHRYAGLTIALFLIVSGLTGSIIAFYHELDEGLNSELFSPNTPGEPLSPYEWKSIVEKADPRVEVTFLPLEVHEPGESVTVVVEPRIDPATGAPYEVGYNQVFVDPVNANILGNRLWGDCCFERKNLLPYLYTVHYSLHLPHEFIGGWENMWGRWLMGGIATIWFLDCFVGMYLTFPPGRPFLEKWKPAWKVRRDAGAYRMNFDMHRAGALWPWVLLIFLSMSSIYLNLGFEVFRPVLSTVSTITPDPFEERMDRLPDGPYKANIGYREIEAGAKAEAQRRDWDTYLGGIGYSPHFGIYSAYFFPPGGEHAPGLGHSTLHFEGSTGEMIAHKVPGEGTIGDFIMEVQFPVHSGQIAGLPGRIVVSMAGLLVAMLSVTGIVIWWVKRKGLPAKTSAGKSPDDSNLNATS